MQCHSVIIFMLGLISVQGSIIEVNETTYRSWPALYALDDWASCQQPDDEYCIVDAKLQSDGPSPLLDLLEAYSAQTLKHFNRTVIQRGMCLSECARRTGVTDFSEAARLCLNQRENATGLTVSILSVRGCQSPSRREWPAGAGAFAIFCLSLVLLAVIATVLEVLGDKCGFIAANKYLTSFSLKRNWAILTYDRSKPRQDQRMKDLAVLEGFRVLAIQCVMFSHVLFMYMYSFVDNPEYVEKMYDQLGWQTMLNSPLWLQAFLCLSAFLATYMALVSGERRAWGLRQAGLSIATRWVRLTPVAMFAMWLTMSWFPGVGAGPLWWWAVTREAHDCAGRWWHHALYWHNHLPLGKFCMGHTWYLAVDMQLHAVGGVVLVLLTRRRAAAAAAPLYAAAALLSGAGVGLTLYLLDLSPIVTMQAPQSVHNLFSGARSLAVLYLPAPANVPGHAAGAAAAFLLYRAQKSGTSLKDNKLFTLAFHLSLVCGSAVVMAGAVFLRDAAPAPGARWAALYAALDRPAAALAAATFMLGCVAGCKSGLRTALSWRGFHPLGRLSYCAFLLHFVVLRGLLAADTRLLHASLPNAIMLLITMSVITYVVSIPVCLLVEIPSAQLWKALTTNEKPVDTPPPAVVPELNVKPFDLVANVGRRRVTQPV